MKKKQIFLNILWVVLAMLFLANLFYIKGNYYHDRYVSGWFGKTKSDQNMTFVWVAASFIISSLPMLSVIAVNIIPRLNADFAWKLIPLGFCITNIGFEVLSAFGSGLTLDNTWSEIVEKMLKYHGASAVVIILMLTVSLIERRKHKGE